VYKLQASELLQQLPEMDLPANRSSRTQVSSATRRSPQGRPASAGAPLLAVTTTLPNNLQRRPKLAFLLQLLMAL